MKLKVRNVFIMLLLIFIGISILPVMGDSSFSLGTNLNWSLQGKTIDIGIVSTTGLSGHYLFSREASFFFDTAFQVEYKPVLKSFNSTFNGNMQMSYRREAFFSSLNTSLLLAYDTSGEYSNVSADIMLPLSFDQIDFAVTFIPSVELQWIPELTGSISGETILTFSLFEELLFKPKLKLEYVSSSQYDNFNIDPAVSITWYPSINYTIKIDTDWNIPSNTSFYGYAAKLNTSLQGILNLGMATLLHLNLECNVTSLSKDFSSPVIDLFPSLSLDLNLTEKMILNVSSYIMLDSINISYGSNTSISVTLAICYSL